MSQLPKSQQAQIDELESVASYTLEVMRELGVDHGEVSASRGEAFEVGVRDGDTELLKDSRSSALSVRIIQDERVAVSATNDISQDAIRDFIKRTQDMASVSEPDPLALPPDPGELQRSVSKRDLGAFDPRAARFSVSRGRKLALTAERAARRHDKRVSASEGASFARSVGHSVLATSGGFLGHSSGTFHSLSAHVIANDSDQKKRNGSYASAARFFEDLDAPAEVGREAARRAVSMIGATKLETGKMPIVFDKDAASDIVSLLVSCLYGDSVFRDQSYLADRLGSKIASEAVTIIDDPFVMRGIGSRKFDAEGRRTRKLTLVKSGVLDGFLLDTYSSRKLKMDPTGSAAGGGGIPHPSTSNLYLRKGRYSPEGLLRGIDHGLFVTQMMGFGFDALTGNFSRGAAGFRIEKGKLAGPVSEVTISRNLDDLLQGIEAVANDLEQHGSIASPSFRVDEMTVSGRG